MKPAIIIIALLCAGCQVRNDDSDMPDGRPSGFLVKTDALTGCQYLSEGHAVTPRMGRDGKQVCK